MSQQDPAVTERALAGMIDPGRRAMVIAVAVLVLAGSFALPFSANANGWQIFASAPAAVADAITLPSRAFTILAVAFGVVGSMLSLVTRRWVLALITAAGCTVSSALGLLTIWSRQTISESTGPQGAGIGLLIAWLAVIVLAYNWASVAWSRSAALLEAEQARREAQAAEPDGFHYRLGAPTSPSPADPAQPGEESGDSTGR